MLAAANVGNVGAAEVNAMAHGVAEVNVLGKQLTMCEAGLIGA